MNPKKRFLLDLIKLKRSDANDTLGCNWCDTNWNIGFIIPDKKNDADYPGTDADTGQWLLCAYAEDSVGNVDTICIQHAPDLTWKIDTRKPIIDSVQILLGYDANNDGIAALGDSLYIIGWGLSNPWIPEYELDSMVADVRRFGKGWVNLDNVLNNNRIFRKKVCLDVPVCIDTQSCDLNQITVWAWDNACNYDTLRQGYCGPVDLDMPILDVIYEYYRDFDTSYACIGIGDQVRIKASVPGIDIVSVTADLKDAGIDALNRVALPLPYRGGGVYDTIWTVTKPPIVDGKDANNTMMPLHDSVYTVRVTVCDDADNCSTFVSAQLNRTLDTRVPRPVGFACPESIPCALHSKSLPCNIIQLYWDKDCDEADAWYFYVYMDDGTGYDSVGATYENEYPNPYFNFWQSEPLAEGYYSFKIKTEDDCGNLGDYSCAVGAFTGICGDVNRDGVIDVGDVVYLINYLFKGGPAPDPLQAGDVNCDGVVDVGDVVYLINYLFKGGPAPCS